MGLRKVFISIPWFYPAYRAGGPVQSVANLVNEYSDNIEFRIFCADTDLNNIPLENIIKDQWVNYNAYTKIWYSSGSGRFSSLKKQVNIFKPDVLYIIGMYSPVFNILPLFFCKVPSTILSVRGMLHPGALLQKPLKKKSFLALFKLMGVAKRIAFHATDKTEADYIKHHFSSASGIFIAGNFPRRFKPLPVLQKQNQLSVISIALISPMKNHLLVLEALQKYPLPIHYHICGPVKDPAYWELCLQQIAKLPSNVEVTFHGNIDPQEVINYLGKAHLFILPSESENFGHSIIEALSAGKPVITSMHTPWNHLDEAGAGSNVALNKDAIRAALQKWAEQTQEAYALSCENAAKYAENSIDTEKIRKQYNLMFQAEQHN